MQLPRCLVRRCSISICLTESFCCDGAARFCHLSCRRHLQEKKLLVFESTVGRSTDALTKLTAEDLAFLFQ